MTVTNKRKILAVGPAQGALKEYEQLAQDYEVHMIHRGPREEVKEAIREACLNQGPFEAAFILFANSSYGPMDEELLGPLWKNGNNVGVFAQCGTGYDNVMVDHISNHGCYFTNTPDAVTASTADFTVFLFLSVLRAGTYNEEYGRSGLWHKGLELSTDPAGLTLGVFGMGRIGKDFVRKVQPFGVKVIYNTRTQLPLDQEEELGLRYVSKDELLKTSDIISCLCPGTPETYHLIDTPDFEKMKDGVFFINSSRGSVVNTQPLIDALQSGKVKRAGLDVFEGEPGIPQYFLDSPRVTATPHVAAYTTGTIYRGEKDAMSNVRAFLEKGKPINNVNGPF
ncbi:glycerate-and formate-dehydrogenase [Naematelia encephala]|uniref:Glycerate-and formate-dehydrogenase n=1 Tax=Naematelia encephala TaxID=71784 RepID=A0A1Y2ASD4_9TREE|nr:glycerate-and formate-dehydrogenase [Naematelia encephala]